MKISRKLGSAFAAALLFGNFAFAGNTATQTVTFSVTAINEISISGNPGAMTVAGASAGASPNSTTESSTRYAITTNASNSKITAAIDSPLPPGVLLIVNMGAPTGAVNAGQVVLGTSPSDVITGVSRLNESDKGISYTLSAASNAGVVPPQSRTVTFTVTAGVL